MVPGVCLSSLPSLLCEEGKKSPLGFTGDGGKGVGAGSVVHQDFSQGQMWQNVLNGGPPASKTNMCVPGHLMSTKVESHWPRTKYGCIDKETAAQRRGRIWQLSQSKSRAPEQSHHLQKARSFSGAFFQSRWVPFPFHTTCPC